MLFSALICFILLGCESNAPQEQTSTPDANPGFAVFEGPEIDMLKKSVQAYVKGDFETFKSFFSDTARVAINVWPLGNSGDYGDKTISVDSLISSFKYRSDNVYSDVKVGDDSIYEVIGEDYTDKSQLMHGHIWMNWSGKMKESGQIMERPVFVALGIQNNKFVYMWMIHNQLPPPQVTQPVTATKKK